MLDKFKDALFAGDSHLARTLIDECCERGLVDAMYEMRVILEDTIRTQKAALLGGGSGTTPGKDPGGESPPGSN